MELSRSDEGKTVVAADGSRIGTVEEVRGEEVWVDPDADVLHDLKEATGWEATDRDDAVQLQPESIADVTDEEVRLADELPGE